MSISQEQRRLFFAELRKAARAVDKDAEEYRKEILLNELGVEHMSDVSSTTGFDKLMQRIYTDIGDYERALKFATSDVRRLRHLAVRSATRILVNRGEQGVGDYVIARYIAGVFRQMGFSSLDLEHLAVNLIRENGWDDFPVDQLRRVVIALTRHANRRQ